MASNRAPKQWQLTTNETLNSFKNWKENLVYTLSLDKSFAPFLKDGLVWQKHSTSAPTRGFTNDDASVTENRQSAAEKCATLNLMLGQIANYATIISRNQIIKGSTSLNDIWDKIRQHYGFHTTGSRFLDLSTIRLQPSERPEDLYQRLVSFIDDNLLTKDSTVTHHAVVVSADEEVSPSLENVTVLLWLERLHVQLPALVKQRYGAELRNKTLASIKPEISQALSSLLEELSSTDDSRVSRAQSFHRGRGQNNNRGRFPQPRGGQRNKYCCLCRSAGRPNYQDHYLSQCRYLPEEDRRRMTSSNVRNVEATDNYDNYDDYDGDQYDSNELALVPAFQHGRNSSDNNNNTTENNLFLDPPLATQRRVTTRKSPKMQCFYGHIPVSLLLDSGAELNLVGEPTCKQMGLQYSKTNQGAQQVDMKTPLPVIGEVSGIKITKEAHVFVLDALVIKDDIGDIVAGEPFLEQNDVAIRPAKQQIIIKGREIISYAL